MEMRFWKRVLAGSLGVLGLAAFVQAQAGSDVVGVKARPTASARQRPARATQPDTYGTSKVSYYDIDAYELMPRSSDRTVSSEGALRYQDNADDEGLGATLHLPAGALIVSVELDYYDISPDGRVLATLTVCDYEGQNCTELSSCDVAITVCSGFAEASGYSYTIADVSGYGLQVDNFENRYILDVGNTTTDGSTAISRISIGYKLQVSPGPATATFTDVPTSHPFFKFVEALHAAGITNGYPDGRFGVNDPITRGQMAVYLAAALGLNWP